MDLDQIYLISVVSLLLFAVIVFPLLLKINAPYGRHHSTKWGPEIGARASWVIMESPAVVCFAALFFTGSGRFELLPLLFFCLWQTHYCHRTFVFPFRMKIGGKKAALLTTAMAFVFNIMNGSNNAYALTHRDGAYEASWLIDPRFIVGVLLFISGFIINRWSDAILRSLRKPGETGYTIPRRGLFRWVSCPNYLGELIEWAGWALATFNLAGLAFFVFSAANLVPRAMAHHKWYKERFSDYPGNRRAIVPGLL